jgi:D-sedoheptulose 7-phosphate isomerase
MENQLKAYARGQIEQSASIHNAMLSDEALLEALANTAQACIDALKNSRKLLFAGNGGSAADAQHLAGELVSRFNYDRPGLCAFSLTTDTSVLTAIGNDYGYERLFARQIEAVGVAGDIFIGISTSGRSPNILAALRAAREKGMVTVGFSGRTGTDMLALCDYCLCAPADTTPRIQECHILLGHTLCGLIEQGIFPKA